MHFEFQREPNLLVVVTAGPRTPPAERREFFAAVAAEARRIGVSRVLVDSRNSASGLSTMDRYQYGELIAEQLRGFRAAFLLGEELTDRERFGETVAVNRGGDIRVFTDVAAARAWLEV